MDVKSFIVQAPGQIFKEKTSHALPELPLPSPFIEKLHSPLLFKTLSLMKNALFSINTSFISFGSNNAINFCINIYAFDLINQY